jgi:outer membrane protein OmpA-like peptidoglycan-associated protein
VGHDYYNDYDDDDGTGPSRWLKVVVICLVGAFVAGGGFWILTREGKAQPGAGSLLSAAPEVEIAGSAPATAAAPLPNPPDTLPSTSPTDVPQPAATEPTPTPTEPLEPATTSAVTGPGYPTSADGTPLPLIVTYDTDTITVTGYVPSQAAKDRVGLLATANSKTEARLENNLVVNEDVPIGVGIRVIELDSARFPEGSADLLPAHAAEFERVASVMHALPNVTVLVIGHADQRGDDESNHAISAERAEAVVDFLTYLGVSPTRLASRAVGEADLLTLADDNTALALNRRTEFVFYGVLVE